MTYQHIKIVALTSNGVIAHEATADDFEAAYAIADVYSARELEVRFIGENGEVLADR